MKIPRKISKTFPIQRLMSIVCRRSLSTSATCLRAAAGGKILARPKEEAEEQLRDPPPPANFPSICPKNPKLRNIVANVDKNVFQRNGLHNIPYRDSSSKHLPPQVFDGERWPDLEVKTEIPIKIGSEDVIDVWTQKSEEKAAEQANRVVYHDIPHDALKKLIAAIRHPVEVRLLPHIIREWHRQGFPISLVDSQKIARLSTQHNEVEVVLQMVRPDVYGLYYDIGGIREITRGMAKKAAQAEQAQGQADFDPDNMLKSVPELLKCSVGADSKRILTDPPVLGTQLWGFVARFNGDEGFRTSRSVMEMYGLVERLIESLVASDFGPIVNPVDSLPAAGRRQLAFNIKYQTVDYIPLVEALRQFIEIISAPYRACLPVLETPSATNDGEGRQLSGDVRHFLHSGMSISAASDTSTTESDAATANHLKWTQLNRKIEARIRDKKLCLVGLSDWEWEVLKQYTTPAAGRSNSAVPVLEYPAFYLPLRAQWALARMEDRLREWRKLLKLEKIPATSQLKLEMVKYGENLT